MSTQKPRDAYMGRRVRHIDVYNNEHVVVHRHNAGVSHNACSSGALTGKWKWVVDVLLIIVSCVLTSWTGASGFFAFIVFCFIILFLRPIAEIIKFFVP